MNGCGRWHCLRLVVIWNEVGKTVGLGSNQWMGVVECFGKGIRVEGQVEWKSERGEG